MKAAPHIALISFLPGSISVRSLSSYLKANGFDVLCLYCPGEFSEKNLVAVLRIFRERSVSLVGVSLVTDDYRKAVTVTEAIRAGLNLPVIWGGAHVNVRPEESLVHADMICLGEGEEALLDLARSAAQGRAGTSIPNIWFRGSDGVVRNELRPLTEDLDRYPMPDFDPATQFVMTRTGVEMFDGGRQDGQYSIMTSRGCPYSCHYCYNSYRRRQYKGKGRYLRARSIDSVIAELLKAKETISGLKKILFWDDSFIARSAEELRRFRDAYRAKIGLPFFALTEPMAFDKEKIVLLKESGLQSLQIGLQSGSDRVNRDIYNRRVSREEALRMARDVHDLGVEVIYDLIFNNPYETTADLAETIDLVSRFPKPYRLQGYNLIFYPGTVITEKALQDGYLAERDILAGKYRKDGERAEQEVFLCSQSTIQAAHNTPIGSGSRAEVSSRFYDVHFDYRHKAYLNDVLSLLAYRRLPLGPLARMLNGAGTPLKRAVLAAIQACLRAAVQAAQAMKKNGPANAGRES